MSYTGIVVIEGTVDGEPVRVGGLGGIATHPDTRGMGLARQSIEMALELMHDQEADFALLVCRDELISYYEGLGWRLFDGTLLVTQFGVREVFTFNNVMVRDVTSRAPRDEAIDLLGPPW